MSIERGMCPECGYSYEDCTKLGPSQTPPCCEKCYHPILGIKSDAIQEAQP